MNATPGIAQTERQSERSNEAVVFYRMLLDCIPGHYHFLWYRRKGGFADGQEEAGEGVVDEELHRPCKRKRVKRTDRPVPDRKWVHKEFRREVVTLQLLWQECKVLYPDGYKLTQLYELYLGLYS